MPPTCMSLSCTVPVLMSSWSASVDLPWSMCAMMEKFLIRSGGTCTGGRKAFCVSACYWQPCKLCSTSFAVQEVSLYLLHLAIPEYLTPWCVNPGRCRLPFSGRYPLWR